MTNNESDEGVMGNAHEMQSSKVSDSERVELTGIDRPNDYHGE